MPQTASPHEITDQPQAYTAVPPTMYQQLKQKKLITKTKQELRKTKQKRAILTAKQRPLQVTIYDTDGKVVSKPHLITCELQQG